MTSPLDEKGLLAARKAVGTIPGAALWIEIEKAIRAYLSATALPDELEVVAWRHTLHMDGGETAVRLARAEVDRPWGNPGIDFDNTFTVTIEPLVRRSQAHSTIAALRAISEAMDEEVRVAMRSMAEQRDRAETAEAEVKRLTEDNETLRVELGSPDDAAISARFNRLYGICRRILWTDASTPAIGNEQTNAALADLAEFLFAGGIDAALSGSEKE